MKIKALGRVGILGFGFVVGMLSQGSTNARADLVFDDSGDINVAPFYRSIALQGITFDGGSDNSFAVPNGYDYTSNAVPMASTSVHATATQNGATVRSDAYAVFNGFYSAKNYANMEVTNAQAADGYYTVAGQGTRTTVLFHTPEAAAQRSVFHWHVSGSDLQPFGQATSRLDFLAGELGDKDWNYLFTSGQAMTVFGPGDYTYTYNARLDVPIDFFFWSSAFAELDRGVAPQGSNPTLRADYSSTFTLDYIELFDENNNPITDWTLEDLTTGDTVFNQDGPLPEPSTILLLCCGVGAMSMRRRLH